MSFRFSLHLARPSRQHWLGYLLLAPAVIMVALIIIYPLLVSIDISFQDIGLTSIGAPRKSFTTANYVKMFTSNEFWQACLVTLKLVTVVSAVCFVIGLGTALLVNEKFKGRTVARLMIALPWAVPEVIAVVIFSWIFDSTFGLMNWLLVSTGLSDNMINWYSQPGPAFWVVAFTMIWKGYPFVSIITLAGLQSIPEDFYNASRVDGANAFQRFRWITIPMLMPVLGITMVLVMLWVFRDFSIIKVMTDGGPIGATTTLSILTYEQAFSFFKMGYASAIGVVTLVLSMIASMLMIGRKTKAMY